MNERERKGGKERGIHRVGQRQCDRKINEREGENEEKMTERWNERQGKLKRNNEGQDNKRQTGG